MNISYENISPEVLSRALGGTSSEDIQTGCVFYLADTNTAALCLPRLGVSADAENVIVVDSGDEYKTVSSAVTIWEALSKRGATRRSILVCVGGGMVTDMGGFAASTFKRGIDFINIPTTLLAMVDASVGGKTGVNLGGLKNEVGVFRDARKVFIDTNFLKTLDRQNMLSGYAEMLKHSLLSDMPTFASHVQFDILEPDLGALSTMIRKSVEVKSRIVEADPTEHGLRKALNLGHTIGHAIETFLLRTKHPQLHGYCVAWGLVGEMFVSVAEAGLPTEVLRHVTVFVREHYGRPQIECRDYDALLEIMSHDKKNSDRRLSMTLLSDVGKPVIDAHPEPEVIREALDFIMNGN